MGSERHAGLHRPSAAAWSRDTSARPSLDCVVCLEGAWFDVPICSGYARKVLIMPASSRPPGRRFWLIAISSVAAWLTMSRFVVPALIRSAYHGESIALLNRIIVGQASHPVEYYLESWRSMALPITILLFSAIAVSYLSAALGLRRRIGRWRARFAEREAALEADAPRPAPAQCAAVAVWCGLLAGWWEAAYTIKKIVLGEWIPQGLATTSDVAWMAPLTYGAAFLLLALPLALVARLRPRWLSLKWVVFAPGFLAVFSMSRATAGRLEVYGAIPLAAGVAWVGARLAVVYSDRFMRGVRLSLSVMALAILGLALGLSAWDRVSERAELANLPLTDPDAPNVLLIVLDAVRAKNLSVYGYGRPTTPTLERLAERGVAFERAVATSPWTLPTHASLFTGRHAHELSVDFRIGLGDTYPTLAELLRDNGYHTAGFVANLYYCAPQFGLDRGFIRYDHWPITWTSILRGSWLARYLLLRVPGRAGIRLGRIRKTAEQVNEEFLGWLSGIDGSRPFFTFLNYFDAHSPYLPPEDDFLLRFVDEPPRYALSGSEYSERQLAELTAAYDGSIAYLDAKLGELLDELDARGVLDSTLVIVTSDHGEQFGEHGLVFHGNSLYMPLLHVPLLASWPGVIPSGVRVREPVSLRHIPATVAALLGFPSSPFPGRSLASYWRPDPGFGARAASRPILSEVSRNRRISADEPTTLGDMRSLVMGRLHYILRGDGHEELYDWFADPDETRNLAASEEGEALVAAFRESLMALVQPSEDVRRTIERAGGGD